jgi:hypothetical protein
MPTRSCFLTPVWPSARNALRGQVGRMPSLGVAGWRVWPMAEAPERSRRARQGAREGPLRGASPRAHAQLLFFDEHGHRGPCVRQMTLNADITPLALQHRRQQSGRPCGQAVPQWRRPTLSFYSFFSF